MSISHDILMGFVTETKPTSSDPYVQVMIRDHGHQAFGLYMALLECLTRKDYLTTDDLVKFCLETKTAYAQVHQVVFGTTGVFEINEQGHIHAPAFTQYKLHTHTPFHHD